MMVKRNEETTIEHVNEEAKIQDHERNGREKKKFTSYQFYKT